MDADITSQKQYENDLRNSENRLRLLIENLPSVVWTRQADFTPVFLSHNIEDVTGFTAEELSEGDSCTWLGRIHADDLGMVKNAYKSLFEDNARYRSKLSIAAVSLSSSIQSITPCFLTDGIRSS